MEESSKVIDNNVELVKQLSMPLYLSKGWLKFMGVLSIIYGILTAITVVGIVFCWLPIWLGVLLFKSASKVEVAYLNGDAMAFLESQNKIKTYFTVLGILAIIGLLATVTMFIFGAVMGTQLQQLINANAM